MTQLSQMDTISPLTSIAASFRSRPQNAQKSDSFFLAMLILSLT